MIQLTIIIDDKVGKLASILNVLAEDKINIHGISTERGPISEIRLIVDDPERTKSLLEKSGFVVYLTNVLGITLSDSPGELAKIAEILRSKKVSIEYIYRFGSNDGFAKLAMHTTNDLTQVKEFLKDFNVE